jgi:hypothetical protein
MNILVVSDIHNDVENILSYMDKLESIDFDVVVAPGDFTDVILPKGFTRTDIGKLIIEELRGFGKPVLALPGNMDKEILALLEEEKISLHGSGKIIKDVGFYGFGGAKTPFNSSFEPDEDEIKAGLQKAFEQVKNAKIKVQAVRKFIEEKQPDVAISAHIHEARGVDELGKTKLINAGRFPEGHCGLVSMEKGETKVKMINLI